MLFQKIIEGWASWGRVYCDLPAFEPLIREILRTEGLRQDVRLSRLTPGTNAVFRAEEMVIKIYAPAESGMDSLRDYDTEKAVSRRLTQMGVRVPKILAAGEIRDAYLFRYLIMEYMPGEEAGKLLSGWETERKHSFVQELSRMLERLHQPFEELPSLDYLERARSNPRLNKLPATMRDSFQHRLERIRLIYDGDLGVLVHGDLTGENVLIGPDEKMSLIDLADALRAPVVYEWPPLVFELFQCDPELVCSLVGEQIPEFTRQLLDGVVMHDFGPDLVRGWEERCGVEFGNLEDLEIYLNGLWNRSAGSERKR